MELHRRNLLLSENQIKRKEGQVLLPCQEIKKSMKEGDGDSNCNWCARNNFQNLDDGAGRFGNRRTSRDNPN